jgi:hypothetical protein
VWVYELFSFPARWPCAWLAAQGRRDRRSGQVLPPPPPLPPSLVRMHPCTCTMLHYAATMLQLCCTMLHYAATMLQLCCTMLHYAATMLHYAALRARPIVTQCIVPCPRWCTLAQQSWLATTGATVRSLSRACSYRSGTSSRMSKCVSL